MRTIGLTGGIASGKSTVSAILCDLGAYIVDADRIARDIVIPGEPAWQAIVDSFGSEILLPDGNINRKILGEKVFKNAVLRHRLDDITHPYVKLQLLDCIKKAQAADVSLAILDVPLLIEVGWQELVDEVWVVYVDESTQLERLKERNHLSHEQAMARIESQMPLTEKLAYADVIIDNNGTIENTKKQVIENWQQAEKKAAVSG